MVAYWKLTILLLWNKRHHQGVRELRFLRHFSEVSSTYHIYAVDNIDNIHWHQPANQLLLKNLPGSKAGNYRYLKGQDFMGFTSIEKLGSVRLLCNPIGVHWAIGGRCALNIKTFIAMTGNNFPIAIAGILKSPLLVISATPGPYMNVGAVSGRSSRHVKGLAGGNHRTDPVPPTAQVGHLKTFIIIGREVKPLLYVCPIRSSPACNINSFTTMLGHKGVNAVKCGTAADSDGESLCTLCAV